MAQGLSFDEDDEFDPEKYLNTIAPPSLDEPREELKPVEQDINDVADEVMAAEGLEESAAVPSKEDVLHVPGPKAAIAKDSGNPYSNMLEEYKKLQKQQLQASNINELNRAGATIGQAFAGGVSGKFDVNQAPYDAIQKSNELPVKQFESSQKMGDVSNLRDANSSISDFFRKMAIKRGFAPEDVEGKSAWDIQEMAKVIGKPSSAAGAGKVWQQTKVMDPSTGVVTTKLVNMVTGEVKDEAIGQTGYAQQFRTDPHSQEVRTFNPGTGQARGLVTGPSQPIANTPVEKQKNLRPQDIYNGLDKDAQNKIDEASKTFGTENKDQTTSYYNIGGLTDSLIDKAVTNPASASQVGAQIAEIYEKGRKTDEDVMRYVKRSGVGQRIEDTVQSLYDGTFTQDRANDLKQALKDYKTELKRSLRNKASHEAQTISQRLESEVDPNMLTPLIFSEMQEQSSEKKKPTPPGMVDMIEVATGKHGFIPKANVEAAIKSKEYKLASPK